MRPLRTAAISARIDNDLTGADRADVESRRGPESGEAVASTPSPGGARRALLGRREPPRADRARQASASTGPVARGRGRARRRASGTEDRQLGEASSPTGRHPTRAATQGQESSAAAAPDDDELGDRDRGLDERVPSPVSSISPPGSPDRAMGARTRRRHPARRASSSVRRDGTAGGDASHQAGDMVDRLHDGGRDRCTSVRRRACSSETSLENTRARTSGESGARPIHARPARSDPPVSRPPTGPAPTSVVDRQLARIGRAEPVERERSDDHRGTAGELARHEHERGRIVERHRPDVERVEPAAARTGRRVRAGGQVEVGDPRLDVEDRSAVEQVRRPRTRPRPRRRARCAPGSGRRGWDGPGSGWRRSRCGASVGRAGTEQAAARRVVGVAWVHGPVEEGHEPGPVEAVETIEGGESAGSNSTTPRVTGAERAWITTSAWGSVRTTPIGRSTGPSGSRPSIAHSVRDAIAVSALVDAGMIG